MADLGSGDRQWLVSPTKEIDDMWIQVQIQEKKSRIVRWQQDIEDLMKGKILDFKARIKMAEMEIGKLEAQLVESRKVDS